MSVASVQFIKKKSPFTLKTVSWPFFSEETMPGMAGLRSTTELILFLTGEAYGIVSGMPEGNDPRTKPPSCILSVILEK